MFEFFLMAQCSITLPNGTTQNFEFCGVRPTTLPSQVLDKTPSLSEDYQLDQPPYESHFPIVYQYLTQENYHHWQALAQDFDPITGSSFVTLYQAEYLFGYGQVIQTKGLNMQKIQWQEWDRIVEAWFKFDRNRWVLVHWRGRGF